MKELACVENYSKRLDRSTQADSTLDVLSILFIMNVDMNHTFVVVEKLPTCAQMPSLAQDGGKERMSCQVRLECLTLVSYM